jgi:energy-coupling factor transporter transmembrane protein EcfT
MVSASFPFAVFTKNNFSFPSTMVVILNVLAKLVLLTTLSNIVDGEVYPLLPWLDIVVREGSIERAFSIAGSSLGAIFRLY